MFRKLLIKRENDGCRQTRDHSVQLHERGFNTIHSP